MIIIRNKYIPFGGFKALSFCGIMFVRGKSVISDTTIRHEKIHLKQQIELLFLVFFIWYLVEYLVGLVKYGNSKSAYRSISFEQEAYEYQTESMYNKRKMFGFLKYI